MNSSVVILGWPPEHGAIKYFINSLHDASLHHYASEVFKEMGYSGYEEFDEAIKRAATAIEVADLTLHDHIRLTFRGSRNYVFKDWKMSNLSRHLVMLNGATSNKRVARYQIDCMKPNPKT